MGCRLRLESGLGRERRQDGSQVVARGSNRCADRKPNRLGPPLHRSHTNEPLGRVYASSCVAGSMLSGVVVRVEHCLLNGVSQALRRMSCVEAEPQLCARLVRPLGFCCANSLCPSDGDSRHQHSLGC